MKRPFSIRAYLGFTYALLLVVSLGAVAFIWSRNEYRVITQELQDLMRERVALLAEILSHEIAEGGEVPLGGEAMPIVSGQENLLAVYIDDAGTVYELVPHSVSAAQATLFRILSNRYQIGEDNYATLVKSESDMTAVFAAAFVRGARGQPIGKVCLLMPLGNIEDYVVQLRVMLLSAIVIVGFLSVGVSILIANYFSRQFSYAQGLAATVASGDYQLRIPEAGPAELRDLSHYLNQMAAELHEQLKMRQTLLANVAHELARPLTGLQLGIESLRNGAVDDPELADDLLVSMGRTIERFKSLIDDITLAAQTKTQPVELQRTALAVEPFLKGVMTRYWPRAQSRGIKIEVHVAADTPPAFVDEKRLNQIVGNLVDNAIKFTPNGTTVRLCAEGGADDTIRMMIHDAGEGIPPEEAEHLFRPFFQGNRGRRIKEGMGLGLAIAKQLALAHGGDLTLENDVEGGTVATLKLPATNA